MKTGKTSNVVLVIVCALLIIFTIKMIWIFEHQGNIPNTLVGCVFSAAAGEAGVLGWIKTAKVKNIDRQIQLEDYERYKKEQEERKNAG